MLRPQPAVVRFASETPKVISISGIVSPPSNPRVESIQPGRVAPVPSRKIAIMIDADDLLFDYVTYKNAINKIVNNKMYDVYGRELLTAPIGQMYIQNRKKYIRLK